MSAKICSLFLYSDRTVSKHIVSPSRLKLGVAKFSHIVIELSFAIPGSATSGLSFPS